MSDLLLDLSYKTILSDGEVVTAAEAIVAGPPSGRMVDFAEEMLDLVESYGGLYVALTRDRCGYRPGGMRLHWGGVLLPADFNDRAGPFPVWLALWHDTDLDERFMLDRELFRPSVVP